MHATNHRSFDAGQFAVKFPKLDQDLENYAPSNLTIVNVASSLASRACIHDTVAEFDVQAFG